ncbi:rRNA-binding ribosome biosynthesis protein UTP25 KNAG_0A05400 [Huiozyma naganishii CBS 8797]|uniref:U3 small nucleolar RNA-associated protein 25 n=1 Tax=Huiozyma naganishii (strain ATCC MYA-139 / BCRC 22969 / CBS 8797 / KCTC 17520 / NBRC 10181 / NCYC 3082 / Yp74L-3) TaxID=1071383 RepID=J7R079_HUIN7|nr:hypothetical protein KNAG_0A05400 [Kazachstania naganishii CBS 8797]CCK68205.1 hypothetical protein KNAG_0A05400 [Kazachstania naganishii CBS 8797]
MNNRSGKRGRKELRHLKRTTKRPAIDDPPRESAPVEDDFVGPADQMVNVSDSAEDGDGSDSDAEARKGKVYGALLTILKSEHPEAKKRKTKKSSDGGEVDKILVHDDNHEELEEENEEEQIDNAILDNRTQSDSEDEQDVAAEEFDSEDEQDPFESHFNQFPETEINTLDAAFKSKQLQYRSVKLQPAKVTKVKDEYLIYSEPTVPGGKQLSKKLIESNTKCSIGSYFLKKRLKIQNDLLENKPDNLASIQKELVDPMFQYKDILYEYENYGKSEDEYRQLYALHALNHVYKTRDRILKNNQRLQENSDTECLDQGFTRPKVLIIAPTRDTAYSIVTTIINKSGIDQVDKRGKFKDQFYEDSLPPSSKPKSFQSIFKGNTNDFFVLGMKFTRKAIKLYSNFYQSDIIVCSPLGLQMIVENTDKKKRQDDFLSSIEITIIDQLHSIEYQNISHLYTIFEHLNNIPDEQHDADFSRIRMWYINDQARFFRQTMVFTKYISPTANSIINGKCRNWSGRWKNHRIVSNEASHIGKLSLRVRQIFQRFEVTGGSIVDEPDYRFKFFTSVIIPGILKSTGYEDGILIYIPEYTDYVRVRNYLKEKTRILFGDINEYSSQKQLTANRSLFQQGRLKVLLYTERLHHYRRYEIKGVKSVIFYKPPSDPEFYTEVVRNIGRNAFLGNTDLNISTVRCIYSKLDALALENVVGTQRAGVLCHGQNEIYEFK